ncbi:MAG: transglycosylase SLT domain-containing protein [Pyrinomonadaceae bacterium]
MKTYLLKVFSLTAIIFTASISFAVAQAIPNNNAGKTADVENAEQKISRITDDSGRLFKEGLMSLQDNRRPQAREKFDKSVEVFLTSGINVRSNAKLQACYTQLIETVYRMEFASNQQPPQIKSLSATCGWNIDNQLAETVAKISLQNQPQSTNSNDSALASAAVSRPSDVVTPQSGFSEQKFEVSPLDELAKLQLTPEEENLTTPEAQQQYEYARIAVSNGSLGFRFQVHPMIQQYVNFYQGRGRGTMETGLYRSGMFMRMARRIFREEGVPENVAWLGQVESTWKPTAMSWASASGLWQFIPGTGTRFGLKRTAYVDERNSFEKATRASAQYLKFLGNRYGGNWELAMAAYNSGEGNVDRAIRRAGASDFWKAFPYLPQETRNYVPNILATILIANNPQSYGFAHVRPAPSLNYGLIRVPPSTGLGLVAQAADTTVEYLRYLNPELRTNMTPPEPYVIRVPAAKVNNVYAVLKKVPGASRNTATLATVSAGENWQEISNRTGISVAELQAANSGASAPKGKVVVPNGNKVQRNVYQRPTNQSAAPTTGGVRVVKAKDGDTVEKLAAREGASAIEVAKYNGLFTNSKLNAGREIKIPGR